MCVLPTTQFAYRKGLGACDALLSMSHAQQSALESGQEARIVQIDFSKVKVKSSMAWSLPVENLLPQKVGSIINYFQ